MEPKKPKDNEVLKEETWEWMNESYLDDFGQAVEEDRDE